MQVPFTRQLGYALVVIVGIGVTSAGCRSTRSSLSGLPGMGWLGSQEADFSELSSEEGKPQLPAPSEAATPEVVTSGSQPKRSPAASPASPVTKYPDTGYPTTLPGATRSSADSGGYAAGRSAPALDGQGSPLSTSGVSRGGETQHGFYGDQYPASGADSTGGGYDRESTVDLAPPVGGSYSGAGSSGRPYSGSDDRGTSGTAAASTPATSSATSAYDRTESSDGTQAGSSGAEPLTQGVQTFAQGSEQQLRQGADSVRQGVSNEYQQFTHGVSNQVENNRQDAIGRASEFQADVDRTVQQGVQQVLQGAGVVPTAESTTGGATDGTAVVGQTPSAIAVPQSSGRQGGASLNPPADVGIGSSYPAPPATANPPAAAPARSTEPWRPGSTEDYPQSPASTSSGSWPSSGSTSSVAPASYDSWGSDSPPATGWSQSQRLAPTYR